MLSLIATQSSMQKPVPRISPLSARSQRSGCLSLLSCVPGAKATIRFGLVVHAFLACSMLIGFMSSLLFVTRRGVRPSLPSVAARRGAENPHRRSSSQRREKSPRWVGFLRPLPTDIKDRGENPPPEPTCYSSALPDLDRFGFYHRV